MKILFICGGLEPGKDGVGDYTRRLSAELIKQGVSVGILAFNDKYVDNETEVKQNAEGTSITCLRLPSSFKGKKRAVLGKKWIDIHNPEWLSLQFVPYSFNKKGLPVGLSRQLKKMGGTRKWHIMFHELWLGLRNNDSLKFRIIGFMQKSIVKSLIDKLKTKVVHTHTQFYLSELLKFGLDPKYLPIFSNIPFNKRQSLQPILNPNKVSFVIFGTIHPNVPVAQFAQEVAAYFNSKKELECDLILVGRSGNEQNKWIEEFSSRNIDVTVLGELKTEHVSHVLQDASFGITTNPIFVVEKSGTVAAMREHNLPVLIVAENTRPKNDTRLRLDSDLVEFKAGSFSKFMKKKYDKLKVKGVTELSLKFLEDIQINN